MREGRLKTEAKEKSGDIRGRRKEWKQVASLDPQIPIVTLLRYNFTMHRSEEVPRKQLESVLKYALQ